MGIQDKPRTDNLNLRSRQLIGHINRADWSKTHEFLNGNLSPANIEFTWNDLMTEYENELGEQVGFEVHGTYLSDPVIAFTYFSVSFSGGEKSGTFVWLRDRLLALHFHNPKPLFLKLVPSDQQNYYHYSVFNDQLVKVIILNDSLQIYNSKSGLELKLNKNAN